MKYNNKGFTFVEFVVYVALLSFLLFSFFRIFDDINLYLKKQKRIISANSEYAFLANLMQNFINHKGVKKVNQNEHSLSIFYTEETDVNNSKIEFKIIDKNIYLHINNKIIITELPDADLKFTHIKSEKVSSKNTFELKANSINKPLIVVY